MTVTHVSRRDKAVSHAHVTVPPTRPDPTRPITTCGCGSRSGSDRSSFADFDRTAA